MGILEDIARHLTPEAGQARRRWVNRQGQRALDGIGYVVGPDNQDRVESAVRLGSILNPVEGVSEAMQGGRQAYEGEGWDRVAGVGRAASGVAGTVAPLAIAGTGAADDAARAVSEALLGWSPARQGAADELGRFATDESGAIRAFHSSPHDFDKFRMDKIGTGEGAQTYGYGLYFAENPAVSGPGGEYYRQFAARVPVADDLAALLSEADDLGYSGPRAARNAILSDPDWRDAYDVPPDLADRIANALPASSPRAYEVNIHADPEDFLDWDAPLREQPQVARRLGLSTRSPDEINAEAENIMMSGPGGKWMEDPAKLQRVRELQDELDNAVPPMTGQEYYRGGADGDVSNILSQMGHGNPQEQTRALAERGIPGIRYRDAGSRGLDGQEGTRNYVVFDENLIEIVRKYGIAGAASLLGMSAADVEAAVGQQTGSGGW